MGHRALTPAPSLHLGRNRRPALLRSLLMCLAVSSFVPGHSAQPDPQFGIKSDEPRTGSMIRRYVVSFSQIPINRRYEELAPDEKSTLHSWWEQIADGDEPPFPADGLRPLHDAIRQAQQKLLVRGELFLIATVGPDGVVTEVKAIGSPSPEMTRAAATILALTKFKPAVCSNSPCQMDFPVKYRFRVE